MTQAPPPDPMDYAAAAEEITPRALPPGDPVATTEDAEPEIPLELVLRPAPRIAPSMLWGGLLTLSVLIALPLLMRLPVWQTRRVSSAEQQALAGLRSLGAAQEAYASRRAEQSYASREGLRIAGLFPEPAIRDLRSGGYSLAYWNAWPALWVDSGMSPASVAPGTPWRSRTRVRPATYTIVALPPPRHRTGLRTFALCSDGVLRVADRSLPHFENACDWPVLPPASR